MGTFSPERVSDFISCLRSQRKATKEMQSRDGPDRAKHGWEPGRDYSGFKNESAEPTASQEEDDRVPTEVPPTCQSTGLLHQGSVRRASTTLESAVRTQLRSNEEPKGGGGADHKDQDIGMKRSLVLTGYETLQDLLSLSGIQMFLSKVGDDTVVDK